MRRPLLRPPRTIRGALFAIIAIALAPLLVLGGTEIAHGYSHERDAEIRASAELARAVGSGFEAFVQSLLRAEHAVAVSVAKHPDGREQTELELAAVQADFPAVRDMSWMDARGQVLATTEPRLEGRSFFAREYVQDILRGAEWRVSPLVRSVVDERPTFIVARAYRPGGVLVGIMAAAVDAEQLTAIVAQRSGGGSTAVLDSQGTLVVAQSSEQIALDWETRRRAAEHPWVRSALAGSAAVGIARSPFSGELRVGANVPIPSMGWVAHASRPLEDAIAPVRRSAALHAVALGVLALSALGTALALAGSIAGPLRELEQHAAYLAANGPGPLRPRGPVEVRRVGRALDSMAASLAERRSELERVNAELERARRSAEEAAAAAAAHGAELEAVIAAMPMALLIFGPDGKVVRANERAGEMMAVGPEDVGRALDELRARVRLFTPEGRALALEEQPLGRALRGELVRGNILRAEREGAATAWIAAGAAPIHGPEGAVRGAVVTVVDVTHLRELQVERETLMQTVSHDLRTPLHVIVGHAEILRRRCDEEARRRSEAILASAGRMTRLIGDLVDAARLGAGHLSLHLEPTDLAAFLAGWRERMSGALAVERVCVEAEGPVPAVLADPARLDQILVNLVSNALKYSLAGSEVRVTLSSSGEALRLSVADRGPGIDPDEIPRLFERYYRARTGAQAEGLGLGLFITRKLVEAHGWRIGVESEPGAGSVFTVVIPANGGRAARPSASAAA